MKKKLLILMALLVTTVTGVLAQATKTIYVYPKEWDMTGCKIALYAWYPSDMFDDLQKSTTYPECYTIEVDKELETCILVQLPESASNDWSNKINQTFDINLEGVDDNILIVIKQQNNGRNLTEVTTIDHLNEYLIPAGSVAIDETNFPDANFRSYITSTYDKDNNGYLSDEEIADVTYIYVRNKEISDLTGIGHFTALKELYCGGNQLEETLDLSNNIALEQVECNYNQLTSLILPQNTVLYYLTCEENQLSSLDVSKNPGLKRLTCYSNELTTLDVSQNVVLEILECSDNLLTSLDVSQNAQLISLDCDFNQLTALDMSQNNKLQSLSCIHNQISQITFAENTDDLIYFHCYWNQLKGDAVDAMIASLPTVSDKRIYFRNPLEYDERPEINAPRHAPRRAYATQEEGNEMTTTQVEAATAKGWTPYGFSGYDWVMYAGTVVPGLHIGIDDVEITEENYTNLTEILTEEEILTSGTVTFNPETKTLTLNNATIDGDLVNNFEYRGPQAPRKDLKALGKSLAPKKAEGDDEDHGPAYYDGLNIELVGENTINGGVFNGGGVMTIKGDGKLLINGILGMENYDPATIVIDGPDITVKEDFNVYLLVSESFGNVAVRVESGALNLIKKEEFGATVALFTYGEASIEFGKNIDVISPEKLKLHTISQDEVSILTFADEDDRLCESTIEIGHQEYYLTFDDINIHSNNYERMGELLTENGKLTRGTAQYLPESNTLKLDNAELKLDSRMDNNTKHGFFEYKKQEDIVPYLSELTIEVKNENEIDGALAIVGGESAVKGDGSLRITNGLSFEEAANIFSLDDATLILGSETLDHPALSSYCESLIMNLNSGRMELYNDGTEDNKLVELYTGNGGAVINLGAGIIFSEDGLQVKTETTDVDGETVYITYFVEEDGTPVNGSVVIDDKETLGIRSAVTLDTNTLTSTYDLQGRRISPSQMQKGIYIVNGKKVVVK